MRYLSLFITVCIMTLMCVFLAAASISKNAIIKDWDKDGFEYMDDCNDNNSSIWKEVFVYIDNDFDNVGYGGLISLCIGDEIPNGYISSESLHNDCDDDDNLVWQYLSGYQDLDKDSYGKGNFSEFCTGGTLPFGFVENNLDCNDNDKNINPNEYDIINDGIDQDCDGFDRLDFDLDGYFRYELNESLKDCIDTNSNIHPGAIEKCNGLDDDCDSLIDEDYSELNNECYVGVGECKVLGEMICNGNGDGVFCRGVADKPDNEICDEKDNDCDGEIDEGGICDFESFDLNIIYPNKTVFDLNRIFFDLIPSNKASEISYIDHNDLRLRESRLCKDCYFVYRNIQFKEGEHNITLKAVIEGIDIKKNLVFFVDSKKPRISKVIFDGTGGFSIKFTEDNPINLTIKYGNLLIGYTDFPIDINSYCVDKSKGRYECMSRIPELDFIEMMMPYNSQEIEVFVELRDITGNIDESKKEKIFVDVIPDSTPPLLEIISPVEGGIYENKRVLFNLSADEMVDLYYVDNSNGRVIKLVKEDTEYLKLLNLKDGLNDITFIAIDKAGNKASEKRMFYVDSQKPRVYSPKVLYKGYTNGTNLEILYSEDNVKNVSLFYSIEGEDNIESRNDCLNGKKVKCDISLDLKAYEGKEISYFFRVEDISGNFMDSKTARAVIDVTPPVLTNPGSLFTVEANRVYFNIEFFEENFFDITFYDPIEKYPRWRRLCSRLTDGKCVKMQVFRHGERPVLLRINDRAGNYFEVEI